jgi:hypothetical protein
MTRGDKLLVAAVLAAAVLAAAHFWFRPADPSGQAVISVGSRVVRTVALRPGGESTTFPVAGELGTTLVEVAGNRVRILDAPCPNHVCMKQGWITRAGASIICMPGKIVVRIEGAAPVDAVTR